jgi:ribosome-associated translation inhibitor RaiA/cold shock CspA family protein
MDGPLMIAFHNMDASPTLEAEIRERFEKLQRRFDRLTGARVSVEALHRQHRTGNIFDVHVELFVPGAELAISRQPSRAKEKYANPNAYTSVRDAFKAAERVLQEYKDKLTGEVRPHDIHVPGTVVRLLPEQDHGFIQTGMGTQLYFHRNSVINAGLEDLNVGDHVKYIEDTGDAGPAAVKVWRAAGADTELGTL